MNGPVVSTPRQFGSLEFTLSATKAVYARGEQVPLTFTVKNVGTQTITATIGACDFFGTKVTQAGNLVWQKSGGCGASTVQVTIMPGETKTYSYAWDQKDLQGNSVGSGRYTIKSWFNGFNEPTLPAGNQETNEFANPIDIIIQTL